MKGQEAEAEVGRWLRGELGPPHDPDDAVAFAREQLAALARPGMSDLRIVNAFRHILDEHAKRHAAREGIDRDGLTGLIPKHVARGMLVVADPESAEAVVARALLAAREAVTELQADLEKLRAARSTPPPRGGAVTRTPVLTKPRGGWQAAIDLAADGTAFAERFAAGERKAQHEAQLRLYTRIAEHNGGGA